MGLVDGARVLVTGGGDGIGAATARRLAAEGASVAVLDRNGADARRVAAECNGHAIECDVADREALARAVDEAAAALGGLSGLFNNAGFGMLKRFDAYTDADWDRIIDVNLRATFVAMRAAVPHLRAAGPDGGAAIVNNVGGVGTRPTRGEGPYSAAKAGMIALTKTAAVEFAPAIRVNAVSPVYAHTALTAPLLDHEPSRQHVESRIPFGRVGTAEEIADVVLFLLSPLSRYVTGHDLLVDGGAMLISPQSDELLQGWLRSMDGSDAT